MQLRTRWMLAGALLALLLVGGVGLATWGLGGALSAAVPRNVGAAPDLLPDARAVRFRSGSGGSIHGWFAPPRAGAACVVLAHAVRADRRSLVQRAVLFQRAGHGTLLFDAQAHGESSGDRITFGHLEALDAAAAVRFAQAHEACAAVAYLGVSQGGAAALLGPEPLPVSALILEGVYATLREAVENRIAIRLGEPGRALAPLLLWQVRPRIGVAPEALAPIHGIREVTAPLLLIAGERDEHATLAQSRRLFDAAPPPKELWVVPGAAHVDLQRFAPLAYERRVLAFLERALRGAEHR